MPELLRQISDAYYNNEDNFRMELRNIFHKNEYSVNERTTVSVLGYFDWNELGPYIQFNIETDEISHATEFYRYDFSQTNRITKDELKVLENKEIVIKALVLTSSDLEQC
jgi:hypothetical protein